MQPGDCIANRYRLLHLIDTGGMGEVWAARNELTHRNFAIKFLLPTLERRSDALERFIREAETAGRLQHPSIVDVYDVAQTEDGRPFIVMELLSGETLEARLEREGRLEALRTAGFVAQVSQALELAHAAGVVHRDLSSANIFLARNPEGGEPIPKILDFGVSKTTGPETYDRTVTATGAVLGCPEYMSPEQAQGAETVDSRTDVWTLGVVLYQCLAGTVPFQANNYNAMMVLILTRPHRPLIEVAPDVDPELAAIVEACLVKDRTRRIQSAREVAVRLGAVARRLAVGDRSSGGAPRRRATDRLGNDRPSSSAIAPAWDMRSPVGSIALRLRALRPRRTTVALTSGAFGIAVGIAGTLLLAPSPEGLPGPMAPLGDEQTTERTSAVAAERDPAKSRDLAVVAATEGERGRSAPSRGP